MQTFKPFLIAGADSGLETNKKPFLLPDKAYPQIENAYVFRDRTIKWEGIKFLGRLRRTLTSQNFSDTTPAADSWSFNLFTEISIAETNAEIEPGSLTITIAAPDTSTFTDQGDGTFTVTGLGVAAGSYINYATGDVVLKFTGVLTGGAAVSCDVNYFPSLPVMGIIQRETGNINFESTLIWDTKYCYVFNGTKYEEYLGAAAQTWNGSDSQFFWGTNYRGSDASVKYLFVTNFDNDVLSPMRYTDGSTWTDFSPAIAGTLVQNEVLGTITTPWNSFGPTAAANFPIVPGTITITISNGIDPDVIYTDPAQDGTLKGSANTNSGTITYATGSVSLTISPAMTADATVTINYQYETTYLFTARLLTSYYGRMLAFDTYEGASVGTAKQYYNRVRFSQIGDPTQTGAWVSTVFGKGGFIDAPTNEEIISVQFFKNTLIVFFERTTWQLRYQGDYGLPFIWERISSDFGSESQFSTILFDSGVLAIGNRAIVGATSQNVDRIDLQIPDQVFNFRNDNEGKQRIYGIRDFQKEIVYWTYNDGTTTDNVNKYPNKILLFNYRNNTYAQLRSSVTALGIYDDINGITWDSTDVYWDDDVSWDAVEQVKQFPSIISGNQQGFIHKFGYESLDDHSLTITGIDRSVIPPTLEIINHNLQSGEIIYLTDLVFIDTSDSTSVATDLNNRSFQVRNIISGGVFDTDNIEIVEWNTTQQSYIQDFSYTPDNGTGTYIGNGKASLVPRLKIRTKDFNPYALKGKQMKVGYIDFLNDVDYTTEVTIRLYSNSAISESGPLLTGQVTLDVAQNSLYPDQNVDYYWNRFYSNTYGQYVSVEITHDDDQINTRATEKAPYVLNGMIIWGKEGGRIVF